MDVADMDPQKLQAYLVPLLIEYVPRVVGLLVALFVARLLAGWAQKLVMHSLTRARADEAVVKFLATLARYGVLTIGVITALGYVGIETASFAAVIAAGGLAVGLAFQGTLSNFAAGVMLLIFRPFKVGDYVKGGGEAGTVVEISIFTTELKTPDAQRVIVGNSAMFSGNITNVTHHPIRRVAVDVGTDYGADLDEVRRVLETVPGKVEGAVEDPPPQIFLAGLGASSIDWQVRIWTRGEDFWDVHQRTVLETKKALDAAGIGIPFPQQDVHLDSKVVEAIGKR